MKIILRDFTSSNFKEDFFDRILKLVEKKVPSKISEDFSIGVILIGQNRIRNLNKMYRGKNQVTSVLSFPFEEIKKPTKKPLDFIEAEDSKEEKVLGEVLLCPSRIKKVSNRMKKNFKKEIVFNFIHGVLHLLGYDHTDTESTKKMRKLEKELMKEVKTLKIL